MKLHDKNWTLEVTFVAAIGASAAMIGLGIIAYGILGVIQVVNPLVGVLMVLALVVLVALIVIKAILAFRAQREAEANIDRFMEELAAGLDGKIRLDD